MYIFIYICVRIIIIYTATHPLIMTSFPLVHKLIVLGEASISHIRDTFVFSGELSNSFPTFALGATVNIH